MTTAEMDAMVDGFFVWGGDGRDVDVCADRLALHAALDALDDAGRAALCERMAVRMTLSPAEATAFRGWLDAFCAGT